MEQQLKKRFEEKFSSAPLMVKSPGRINFIGEHTDYNEGFVLPAAIDKFALAAVSKRNDNSIHLFSTAYNEYHVSSLQDLSSAGKQWPSYILGVVHQLQEHGSSLSGFNLMITGNVPIGAGMSSSAAIECASIFALNELFEAGISKTDLAKMAQKAEHDFAGVKCGIMDQFTSLFGKAGHVIRLDCRTLEHEYVPFRSASLKIVLLDTCVRHSLASSAYNERRRQCEEGVELIQRHEPGVKSLRDVNMLMLKKYIKDPLIYRRCQYVVEETERLNQACLYLTENNMSAFGAKMYATHEGLSHLYEVSCPELDCLIEAVRNCDAVLGARMMGGGFGGCTINIVKDEAVEQVIAMAAKTYREQCARDLKAYVVNIGSGASVVQASEG